MKQLIRNLRIITIAFFLIFIALFGGVIYQQNKSRSLLTGHKGENKLALKEMYSSAGRIEDRYGYPLAYSEEGNRRYAEDELLASALVQIIGDYTHNIANTIEERFQEELTGNERGVLKQFIYDITGRGMQGANLKLALDGQLSRKIAEELAPYRASAVVMNYRTGEILALVNAPYVSPEQVIAWLDIPEGALFNKAILAKYAPGSTFKIITDAAWVSSPEFQADFTHLCTGEIPLLGPGSVLENRRDAGHGLVNREEALATSCNHFFGQVAIDVGVEHFRRTAENFAFNQTITMDKIFVQTSMLTLPSNTSQHELSWFAIGQALEFQELSVTPLHLAMISSAIANDGKMMQARLVLDIQEPGGKYKPYSKESVAFTVCNRDQARMVEEDMYFSVQTGLAQAAQVVGQRIGGKTGTSEYMDEQGNIRTNSLFTGFMKNDLSPIALALVVEGENVDTSSIAGRIFQYVLNLR